MVHFNTHCYPLTYQYAHIDIITHNDLVDAVNHPEKYPELLVRVSGYTAYFKDLNPQMQKEIIDRTEYLLSTGKAVDFAPFPLPEKKA